MTTVITAYENYSVKKGEGGMAKSEVEVKTYVEKIDKLIENDANPRKIGRKQYEALKKSLKDFPEMKQLREIVVDENFVILGGHQRIYALKDLGYKDVIVKQVSGLTARQKREFIIKDNTAAGDWDTDVLANQWDMDELKDFGLPDFKFDKEPKEAADKGDYQTHEVTCPACGHHFELSKADDE